MLAEHAEGQGWSAPVVRPFGYIPMHPAAQVLHYGMTCFEGMKAYRGQDGTPLLFRPEMNMARLARSADRLQLATFDQDELLECIKSLVRVDASWLPAKTGHSLYIRPFVFSSANILGVAKTIATTISVVMSPVGPYFPSGLRPMSLFIEENATRAWPGGAGQYKVGGNYAPSIQPQVQAAASHGVQQVLYTFLPDRGSTNSTILGSIPDSDEAEFEECGAMNIFFLLEKTSGGLELVTPGLDRGTILPGITRDSILALTREWAEFEVSERPISIGEVKQAAKQGRLKEIFSCGTACIVQPIDALLRANGERVEPLVKDPTTSGALAPRLQKTLLDIQYGRVEHPWSVRVT